jgi:hypothetical protein
MVLRKPHGIAKRRCRRVARGANGRPHLASPSVADGVVIRPEREAEHPGIAEVVRAAFVGHADEVASFVERTRASERFIPELALVAEDSSNVPDEVPERRLQDSRLRQCSGMHPER